MDLRCKFGRRGRIVAVVLTLILTVVLSIYSGLFGRGLKEETPNNFPENKIQANVNVAFKGVSVILRNDNNFDWTNTKVTLTHGKRLYTKNAGRIAKGQTIGFMMSDFVTAEGEPFSFKSYKPDSVIISSNEAEAKVQLNQ